MLYPPKLISFKFGYPLFCPRSPEEEFKATLLEKTEALCGLLVEGAPLAPAAAASFDLLSVCACFIAGDHDPQLLIAHEWFYIRLYSELGLEGDAESIAFDFARSLADLVEATAFSLELPALEALVPQLRLAVHQTAQSFIKQDEDVRPHYASELFFRLMDKLLHRLPDGAVQAMADIASELVGALASRPEAALNLSDGPTEWGPDDWEVAKGQMVEFEEVPQPADTTFYEARLKRLQLRRQALPDTGGEKTIEMSWVEFSIELVKEKIADTERYNASLPTTPQRVRRFVTDQEAEVLRSTKSVTSPEVTASGEA